MLVLFPIGVALAGILVYGKLTAIARIPSPIYNMICAFLMGAMIFTLYHYTEYNIARSEAIKSIQKTYQVSEEGASIGLNRLIKNETGSNGFIGYLILEANRGITFTNYLMENGAVVHTSDFVLQGFLAWLYLFVEAFIIIASLMFLGFKLGDRPFSNKERTWYSSRAKQTGNIDIALVNIFLEHLKLGDYQKAGELLMPEKDAQHPTIEIYEYRLKEKRNNDVFLVLQKTFPKNAKTIKRKTVFRCEISETNFNILTNNLKLKMINEK